MSARQVMRFEAALTRHCGMAGFAVSDGAQFELVSHAVIYHRLHEPAPGAVLDL